MRLAHIDVGCVAMGASRVGHSVASTGVLVQTIMARAFSLSRNTQDLGDATAWVA